MKLKLIRQVSAAAAVGLVASALTAATAGAVPRTADGAATAMLVAGASHFTTTPIKHVVVIIGENHSFDNVFATYQPPGRQHPA
jgi:phospholipase C